MGLQTSDFYLFSQNGKGIYLGRLLDEQLEMRIRIGGSQWVRRAHCGQTGEPARGGCGVRYIVHLLGCMSIGIANLREKLCIQTFGVDPIRQPDWPQLLDSGLSLLGFGIWCAWVMAKRTKAMYKHLHIGVQSYIIHKSQ